MTMPLDEKGRLARNGMPCCKDIPNSGRAETDDACSLCSTASAPDELEVVRKLRYRVENPSAWPEGFDQSASDLMREAADALSKMSTIAALRVEVERLTRERDKWKREATTRDEAGNVVLWSSEMGKECVEHVRTTIRAETAEAEVKRLTEDNEALRAEGSKERGAAVLELSDEIEKSRALEAERDALREALAFYADPKTYREQSREDWKRENPDKDPTVAIRSGRFSIEAKAGFVVAPIYHDNQGDRARKAMEGGE